MRVIQIPDSVTGPFASKWRGAEWRSHRTAKAAWARAWPHLDERPFVVRVVGTGKGEAVELPESRPYGSRSGASGRSSLAKVLVTGLTREQIARWDVAAGRAGVSRSEWLRGVADAAS